jgi:hypothetical protein
MTVQLTQGGANAVAGGRLRAAMRERRTGLQ